LWLEEDTGKVVPASSSAPLETNIQEDVVLPSSAPPETTVQEDAVLPSSAPPETNAREVFVSETANNGYSFHANAAVCWYDNNQGCSAGNHAFWTLTTTDPGQTENEAFWQPEIPAEALYDVYVHVPTCINVHPTTQAARYLIQHRDGAEEIVVNQAVQTGWVHLGQFPFVAGKAGFLHLRDVAGDELHTLWYDDAKWVPAGGE